MFCRYHIPQKSTGFMYYVLRHKRKPDVEITGPAKKLAPHLRWYFSQGFQVRHAKVL